MLTKKNLVHCAAESSFVFVKSQRNQTELNLFLASFRRLKSLCAAATLLAIHKVCNNDRHDFQFPGRTLVTGGLKGAEGG